MVSKYHKKDKTVFGNLVNQLKNSDNIRAIVSVKIDETQ